MFSILGKITKRIKSGEIPPAAVDYKRQGDPPPSSQTVRDAGGHGLGKGAHRRRNGGAS
jgi:hypothetical protein